MFQEYLNYCQNNEYDDTKTENVIFQAYLYAFFRHISYIYRLYNTGKICELQATQRISAACKKLKLMQNKLKYQVNIYNGDAKKQVFIVNPINFFGKSENQPGFWN